MPAALAAVLPPHDILLHCLLSYVLGFRSTGAHHADAMCAQPPGAACTPATHDIDLRDFVAASDGTPVRSSNVQL